MNLANQIINTGVLRHDDEKCFWTDSYYSTFDEMVELFNKNGIEIIDHFAQDGISRFLRDKVDSLNDADFDIWCNYHYSICREKSILGVSNHVIIAGRK